MGKENLIRPARKLRSPTDRAERRLVREGITAETVRQYLYCFISHHREVADLTNDGMNYIARCAGVSIEDVEVIEENEMSFAVKATAINREGDRHIGIVRAERGTQYQYLTTTPIHDAVSKAQRYAKKGLLPMTFLRNLIKSAGLTPVEDDLCSEIDALKDKVKRLEEENAELRGE